MSQKNVDTVRNAFEVFKDGLKRGDPAAPFDAGFNTPDAEWVMPPGSPGFRRVYRGRIEFLEFMRTWTEDFEWTIELEQVVDAGDKAVGVFHQRATGKGSGVDPADAFKAAGIDQ